jgi:hypothetical protein
MSIVNKKNLKQRIPGQRRLGKQPAKHDARTLQFEKYILASDLPACPAELSLENSVKSPWGMMDNDKIGDCTCASAGHMIMNWTANAGKENDPTEQQIVSAYSAITGYNPDTGANDNGAVVLDVLNFWKQNGIADDKIDAFVSLEPQNDQQVRESTFLFGGCYLGIQMPLSAQDQQIWSVPSNGATGQGAPGSWGGHAVPVVGYDSRYLAVVTWGSVLYMTWQFYDTYCDEAFAILSLDWLNQEGVDLQGFDFQQLDADLTQINPNHTQLFPQLKHKISLHQNLEKYT